MTSYECLFEIEMHDDRFLDSFGFYISMAGQDDKRIKACIQQINYLKYDQSKGNESFSF